LQLPQEEYASSVENRYGFVTSGNTIKKWYWGQQESTIMCLCPTLYKSHNIQELFSIQEKNELFFTIFLLFERQKARASLSLVVKI